MQIYNNLGQTKMKQINKENELAAAMTEKRLQSETVQHLRSQFALTQEELGKMMTAHQEIKFTTSPPKGRPAATTVRGISID